MGKSYFQTPLPPISPKMEGHKEVPLALTLGEALTGVAVLQALALSDMKHTYIRRMSQQLKMRQ